MMDDMDDYTRVREVKLMDTTTSEYADMCKEAYLCLYELHIVDA